MMFLVLFFGLFWGVLSGHFDGLLLFFGVLSVGVVVYFSYYFLHQSVLFRLSFKRVLFYLAVVWMIILSSARLFLYVLKGKGFDPQLVVLDVSGLKVPDQVLLASVITLTPGTISCDLKSGELVVNALFGADIKELKQGVLCKRIQGLG